MKAAVYYDVNDIRYEEVAVPRIGYGEVLIELKVCGLCGTDVHKAVYKTVKPPIVLGHEVSGKIVETGPGVDNFQVGDRIFAAHHVPCFTCHYCLHGHHTLCRQFKETNIHPGGFAEYIRIPALNVKHSMHKIPEGMSYEHAAMAEPAACCIHGIRLANIKHGDSVLVMGAGQIGVIHAQLAKSYHADKVIISDISDFRLNKAIELGADSAVNVSRESLREKIKETTEGRGVDAIIIAAGIPSLLAEAMAIVARGGVIVVFSPFDREAVVKVDAGRFFEDEITIVGSYSSMPYEYKPALELIGKGIIDADRMITHRFKLSGLKEAIELASNPDEEFLKVVINP